MLRIFTYICEMKQEIKHRRLYAFFNSKVLNVLYVMGVLSLLQVGYLKSMELPVVCSSASFALFIGYSLWLWLKKPKQIVVNVWLSDLTIWFTLFFLIVAAMKATTWMWYTFPIVAAIVMWFIDMINPHDKLFDI